MMSSSGRPPWRPWNAASHVSERGAKRNIRKAASPTEPSIMRLSSRPSETTECPCQGKIEGIAALSRLAASTTINRADGKIENGHTRKTSMWMPDTDYHDRNPYPPQVFFPMTGVTDA